MISKFSIMIVAEAGSIVYRHKQFSCDYAFDFQNWSCSILYA